MTLCVYALTSPPDGRITLRGISGEPLRAVTVGRVAAVVGELARSPKPTEGALRKYDRVVQSLARRLPAILPARFGTGVQDLIELTFILQSRQQNFLRSLRTVRGRVQMTVRVMPGSGIGDRGSGIRDRGSGIRVPDPRSPIPDPGSPIPHPGSPGAAYLRSRAAVAAREREIPGFDSVRAAVRRWVRDERVEKRGPLATVYHLVPRGSAQAYGRALERSARDAGVRVMLSGPWPPYAFSSSF